MGNLVMAADGSFTDPEDKPQSPMEVIAAAGEQRPGIEAQDINDGWLIEATQQLDCGNGMMKYSITLPDGSPFECTPFRAENRRDMSKIWMGAVRQEILNRANAASAATREAALKARAAKQLQGPGLLVTDQLPTPEEAAQLAKAVKPIPAAPPESARAAVQALRATIPQALDTTKPPTETSLVEAKRSLARAKADVAYWRAMVKALDDV